MENTKQVLQEVETDLDMADGLCYKLEHRLNSIMDKISDDMYLNFKEDLEEVHSLVESASSDLKKEGERINTIQWEQTIKKLS